MDALFSHTTAERGNNVLITDQWPQFIIHEVEGCDLCSGIESTGLGQPLIELRKPVPARNVLSKDQQMILVISSKNLSGFIQEERRVKGLLLVALMLKQENSKEYGNTKPTLRTHFVHIRHVCLFQGNSPCTRSFGQGNGRLVEGLHIVWKPDLCAMSKAHNRP